MALPVAQLVLTFGPIVLRGIGTGIKWLVSARHRQEARDGKQAEIDRLAAEAVEFAKPLAHLYAQNGFWYWKGMDAPKSGPHDTMRPALAEAQLAGFRVVDLRSYQREHSRRLQEAAEQRPDPVRRFKRSGGD